MIFANDYGFIPGKDAEENARALQAAVDLGGEILVEAAGVYELSEPIVIGDNTTIRFADGVTIRRVPSKSGKNGNAFINRGAFAREWNYNIAIYGLRMECNAVESARVLHGWRAHVGFMFVEGLTMRDITITGLLEKDYGIQLAFFRNVTLEDLFIEGNKDGVHLGPGNGFVIRRGKFCTFDDPIALNAYDYSSSAPFVGTIENGLIEDCYDLDAESTTGYFCRMPSGMWVDWYEGVRVAHSSTVVSDGYIYRVVMKPDGTYYDSKDRPCHGLGAKTYPDGIQWVGIQAGEEKSCACKNITFRRCHLQKKRNAAFACEWFVGKWARSYMAGGTAMPHSNIVLEDIYVENEVDKLFFANGPITDVTVKNTDFDTAKLILTGYPRYDGEEFTDLVYPECALTLEGCKTAAGTLVINLPATAKITEK